MNNLIFISTLSVCSLASFSFAAGAPRDPASAAAAAAAFSETESSATTEQTGNQLAISQTFEKYPDILSKWECREKVVRDEVLEEGAPQEGWEIPFDIQLLNDGHPNLAYSTHLNDIPTTMDSFGLLLALVLNTNVPPKDAETTLDFFTQRALPLPESMVLGELRISDFLGKASTRWNLAELVNAYLRAGVEPSEQLLKVALHPLKYAELGDHYGSMDEGSFPYHTYLNNIAPEFADEAADKVIKIISEMKEKGPALNSIARAFMNHKQRHMTSFVMQALIKKGVMSIRDTNGANLFHVLAGAASAEMMDRLVQGGTSAGINDIWQYRGSPETPLSLCLQDDPSPREIIKWFITHGATTRGLNNAQLELLTDLMGWSDSHEIN